MTTATLNRPSPTTPAAAGLAPIPFTRLLRVEWGKATDTRAARWLLAITGLATVLIMLAPLIARTKIDQTAGSYLGFAAFALTMLLPVVSIMTLTSEWTQRTVLATFTQEPRRSRVIGAKVGVSLIMAVIAIVFGALVTAGAIGIAAAGGRAITNNLGAAGVLGFALFVLIQVLMGVAFGALLHNTSASIVLFFVLPTIFAFLGSAVKSVGQWIDPSTTFTWVLDGDWGGHVGGILVSTLLWLVLPLAAGLFRTAHREIK